MQEQTLQTVRSVEIVGWLLGMYCVLIFLLGREVLGFVQ